MRQVIIILIGTDEDKTRHYYGPFKDGSEACHWAHVNCKGFDWHWEYLNLVNQPEAVEDC